MQQRFSVRLAPVVAIGALGGCSLLTDLGGLSGEGREGRGTIETSGVPGTVPGSSSSIDAAFDAGAEMGVDAGLDAPPDGGLEAGADATLPFCASRSPAPKFCEDFDGRPFGAGWSSTVQPGGVVSLDETSFVSGPSSRRFRVPTGTPGTCRSVQDVRTLSAPYQTRARVEYDVYLGHAEDTAGSPTNAYVNTFKISGASGTKPCTVSLNPREGETLLFIGGEAANGQALPLAIGVESRRWTRVAIEIVSDPASAPVANVWIDGNIAVAGAPISPGLCNYGLLKTVNVGLFCMSSAADAEARVDNFTADTD